MAMINSQNRKSFLEYNNHLKVVLNCRGIKYEVFANTFEKYPNSRLGKLSILLTKDSKPCNNDLFKLCEDFNLSKNEFYFNKDPFVLNQILNLYTDDYSENNSKMKLHITDGTCFKYLYEQLIYWGFSCNEFENLIDKCCMINLNKSRDFINEELEKEQKVLLDLDFEYDFGKFFFPKIRKTLFNYMEKPLDSIIGKTYLFITGFFLTMSIFLIAINTIHSVNKDSIISYIIGKSIIAWFTLEMAVRLFAYPSFCVFFSSGLNIMEFTSLAIYYVTMYLPRNEIISYIRMFGRIMRVFTYLRIGRHTTGLQTLSDTIKYSRREITFYVFYLFLGVLTFSNICYAFEFKTENTHFTSIPATYWWCIVTMTTVGYGDVVPKSIGGKLFAGICAICGVILIAMPVGLISNKYSYFYQINQKKEQIRKTRKNNQGPIIVKV